MLEAPGARGDAQQRAGHAAPWRAPAAPPASRKFVLISTDKAIEPGQRARRHQAPGRARLPGLLAAQRHRAGDRPLRQRARLGRQRGAAVPRADRARRPGHGHAPGHHALLHDHPRGLPADPADQRPVASRRSVFTLDMGQPVAIRELARADDPPGRQASRHATSRSSTPGLRPGEKLHETLFHPEERYSADASPRACSARRAARGRPGRDAQAARAPAQRCSNAGEDEAALLRVPARVVPRLPARAGARASVRIDRSPQGTTVAHDEFPDPQGRIPGRRARHALPARDQDGARRKCCRSSTSR